MSSISHSTLVDRFPGQYLTQSRGDVIIKVRNSKIQRDRERERQTDIDFSFQGKGVMETFWVLGKSTDGVSVVSEQSIKDYTAVQISPEPTNELTRKSSPGDEEKEKRSVDDYDIETIATTEPLYRFYSRQTTLKAEDQ